MSEQILFNTVTVRMQPASLPVCIVKECLLKFIQRV